MRQLVSGSKKFKKSLQLSHEELRDGVKSFDKSKEEYTVPQGVDPDLSAVDRASTTEAREINSLLQLLHEGGAGMLSQSKRSGWVRIMFENFNGIGIGTQNWKMDRLNHLVKQLQIDVISGCETNIDWRQVSESMLDLLAPAQAKKGTIAHNSTGDILHRNQRGGTMISAIGRLCDTVTARDGIGKDPTNLGRWSWIQLGNDDLRTYIVSAYIPRRPPANSAGETVWEQHECYYQSIGDFRRPDNILLEELLSQMRAWRNAGHEVILSLDANQDIYDGSLAISLVEAPFHMCCLFQQATGEKAPNSHFRGRTPITTIFGSNGLTVGDGMAYPHWYGVGDHRVFVVEVSAASLFGGKYPTVGSAAARTLNCKISRCRAQYNSVLKSLCDRHKMHEKLLRLKCLDDNVTPAQYQLMHNRWDNELGEFMSSAEEQCTKFKSCQIEYSPTVGIFIKRRSVLKWILRWYDGAVPDVRNLLRTAKRNNVENPLTTSREDIEARLVACIGHLVELKKQAPELRRKHLLTCLIKAKKRGDDKAVEEIIRIRRKESDRKRRRGIKAVVKAGQGRMVMAVQVQEDGGLTTYDTHDDIVRVVNSKIGQRYKLGHRSPLSAGRLAEEIGQFGEKDAARQILDGTYEFPDGTDGALIELLKEAALLKVEFEEAGDAGDRRLTVEDFISFWHSAREETSSSDSGRHFGHYIAASDDPELAILHVESMNVAASYGLPLDRWKSALTVLLEKVMGNMLMEKLRAICLLEADFNWWLKITFARKMMSNIRREGRIPMEQFATAGKCPIDGSMCKQMGFFDRANTLHYPAVMNSVDAEQCYDAVNHAATSLAMQAYGMSMEQVCLYLSAMSDMVYHLKTAFKRDEAGFSGLNASGDGTLVPLNYFNGLGQGSGGAPPAWQVVSSLMVGAYKRNGYGMHSRYAWSRTVKTIASILFVDDCDLLHMALCGLISLVQFLVQVQSALHFWARLLQMTGGDLKQSKSFWYLIAWRFVRGVPKQRRLNDLPKFQLYIPQHDGPDVPIKLIDVRVAKKTLGVWTCPDSSPKPKSAKDRASLQLKSMVDKGNLWRKRVDGSKLSNRDRWFSFFTQTKPSMSYGLVPLMDPPEVVTDSFQALYFMTLPALGVNRYITLGWRMLPVNFQGLGLPNMALEKLAESLSWLQRFWGVEEGAGHVVREAYERLQMETGLNGNVFQRSFDRFGILASHTWYKVLWEYLDHFQVKLEFDDTLTVPRVRERDKVFMEVAVEKLDRSEWVAVNRMRKKMKVYFFSQLAHCDGQSIRDTVVEGMEAAASTMEFSHEEPTPADRRLWKKALRILTSENYRFQLPLGYYVRAPHDRYVWYSTSDRQRLLQVDQETSISTLYLPSTAGRQTRRGTMFQNTGQGDVLSEIYTQFASVTAGDNATVAIHSTLDTPVFETMDGPPHLLAALKLMPNQSLWRNVDLDGDGQWIIDGLRRGSLVVAHDGSFMEHLDRTVCSAGLVLFCTHTRHIATASCAERTDSDTAGNYRGELLGGLLLALIMRAAAPFLAHTPCPVVEIACDNMGVVIHGQNRHRPLKEAQKQADLIRCFRSILKDCSITVSYVHVYGHQDDKTNWDDLTLQQQLNVHADSLAKAALKKAVRNNSFISSLFPFESFRVMIGGRKVTSSIKKALYANWGRTAARDLMSKRKIVSESNFDKIYWEGVGAAMASYPQMFRVYVTKHVSHFQGTNRQLSRDITQEVDNICPCCGCKDESTGHITRCKEDGRTAMFLESIDLLGDFLYESHMDGRLVDCILTYLEHRGDEKMSRIANSMPLFSSIASDIDALGWDSLLEGRVPTSLIDLQCFYLRKHSSWWKIKTWASHLIQHLLNITHRQWLYRNARIHLRKLEGLTTSEHEDIFELVKDMMLVDPSNLLPRHRHLLERDYKELGSGSTTARKLWLQQMRSAVSAADSAPPEGGDQRRRRVSSLSVSAVNSYDRYRQRAGIPVTERHNLAKRVRP
jgi:hypothetical protein